MADLESAIQKTYMYYGCTLNQLFPLMIIFAKIQTSHISMEDISAGKNDR